MIYPFTENDSADAYNEWGANCGPNALAFALQIPIASVRGMIPGFEEKRYTSPTMMKAALSNLKKKFDDIDAPDDLCMFCQNVALVRIQWCGPWTAEGANPKWAYRQTHWIVCWSVASTTGIGSVLGSRITQTVDRMVFDCNGGIRTFESWQKEIIPALTSGIKRADGQWYPTHVWRIER